MYIRKLEFSGENREEEIAEMRFLYAVVECKMTDQKPTFRLV
jgi:hypothetical protein